MQSPDFNPHKDNLWKEMIEAAQAEPEEKVWEIFQKTIELETLEWKIRRMGARNTN